MQLQGRRPLEELAPLQLSHQELVTRAVAELEGRGVSSLDAAPPLWRLLWRWNVKLPPRLFMSFWQLLWFAGSYFGLLFGGVMCLLFGAGLLRKMTVDSLVLLFMGSGLVFGLALAVTTRRRAQQLGLSSWESFVRQNHV
ncbi:MAG: DUF6404 family protein [Armatimonas sp.]